MAHNFELRVSHPDEPRLGELVLDFRSSRTRDIAAQALRRDGFQSDDWSSWPTTVYETATSAVDDARLLFRRTE